MEQISKNLEKNITVIENAFQNCGDIVKRRFFVGEKKEIALYMIYRRKYIDKYYEPLSYWWQKRGYA